LEKFFAPLMHRIGELWHEGVLSAAHEHFASAGVRTFLLGTSRAFAGANHEPALVVVTPTAQLHEMGAVLAAAAGADMGWRVVFLGSSLPAAEIAGAVLQNRVRVVALSIVYPPDDPQVASELRQLRQALPEGVVIVVGGRSAAAYAGAIEAVGAHLVRDLREFEDALVRARMGSLG